MTTYILRRLIMLVPVLLVGDVAWLGSGDGIAMIAFLGVVPTALAYVAFSRGLRSLSAGETATLTLAEPLTAAALGAIVLLKGPVTIVADPVGEVLVTSNGDARLATAGTGDVLSGILGALLATGMDPLRAAAAAAWLHAEAARRGPVVGLVAGDLVDLLPRVLDRLPMEA
jgi:NAD(P)H-hydrate epimerase